MIVAGTLGPSTLGMLFGLSPLNIFAAGKLQWEAGRHRAYGFMYRRSVILLLKNASWNAVVTAF